MTHFTHETPMTATDFEPANPDFARAVRESFERQDMLRAMSARLGEITPGFCAVELPFSAAVAQQQSVFHAGAIGAIGDVAAGCAAASLMPAGSAVLTVEYKINLVRAARPPMLRAEGRVVRAGRTLTVCRTDVFRVDGTSRELCAVLQVTLMRTERSA